MTFEATDLKEAETLALGWNVGVEGEDTSQVPVRHVEPEAFDIKETMRLLGGIGRATIYRLLYDGRLERVSGIRRVLITRKSIVRFANGPR